nr:ribonuclease H-like domain-containing protein [Tanacetum cinerariifolium]
MDLCGPMRVESVNEKKYILIIIDDYSRFTWVKCFRSKDEALDFIIKFIMSKLASLMKDPLPALHNKMMSLKDEKPKRVHQVLKILVGLKAYEKSFFNSRCKNPTYGKTSDIDASQLPDDSNMLVLEDIIYSDDEDVVGVEADFNNLESSIPVSPIPTTRIHKDHPVS